MKLSSKTIYGLKILLQIGLDNRHGKTSHGKTISRDQEISENYLEQIKIPLKNSGFVKVTRGCNGGYFLNKDPREITVLDIVELFEGKFNPIDCVQGKNALSGIMNCKINDVWGRISRYLIYTAGNITLLSILNELDEPAIEYFN